MPSTSPSEQVTYSISELAKEFALTTRAIRFYEGEGLLSPQRAGQRRVYAERERVRIKLILRGKRLGLSLSDIRNWSNSCKSLPSGAPCSISRRRTSPSSSQRSMRWNGSAGSACGRERMGTFDASSRS